MSATTRAGGTDRTAAGASDGLWDRAQAAALAVVVAGLRRLSPVAASNLGGAIARAIGPLLPVNRVGHANLRLALPELDAQARRRILRAMWDNLGRTAAEMPHLASFRRTMSGPGWECPDDRPMRAVRDAGGPALVFSGHIGNWEIGFPAAAGFGVRIAWLYRAASNRAVDRLIQAQRAGATGGVAMFPKGAAGARAAFAYLKSGGILGMVVDQKLNEGIAVPFFGHDAMTTPALAQFALRFRCPVLPVRVIRLGPARFRVFSEPPLPLPDTGDREADVRTLTRAVNARLEAWIREDPSCWLWLHRRWPKSAMANVSAD